MKKRIIDRLSVFFQAVDRLLCLLHIKRPKVVVFMDGGICSQMMVYLQGRYYAEHGFDVYYDTLWYETCGKDANGLAPRYFEFREMWPVLEFKNVSKMARKWYLLFFKAKRTNGDMLLSPSLIIHSVYLDGFWDFPDGETERLFAKYYNIEKASIPARAADKVFNNMLGIHVRRGDLAKGDNPYYGGVTEGYFLRAIEFCNKEFKPEKYLFFSDEPDWVEAHICPQVKQLYEIVLGNKGWEDLWLLAHCDVIVASQGSFGKVAARLNSEATLVQCDNKFAIRDRKNAYFIK